MTETASPDQPPVPVPAPARLAIVTGADSGIGKATAELLATEGFDVGITFNTDDAGAADTAAAIRERGQRCFVAQQDLATPQTAGVVDALVEQLGGLGVLVNNGGTGHSSLALELAYSRWRQVIATDLDGAFLRSEEHTSELQ